MQSDITIYAESIDDISPINSQNIAIGLNNVDIESLLNDLDTDDLIDYVKNRSEIYDELYQDIKDEIAEAKYASLEKYWWLKL